jgi:hypothetical protein
MAQMSYPDLTGKVVIFYVNSDVDKRLIPPAFTLRNVSFEDQAARVCVVGEPPEEDFYGSPWFAGASISIPWDSVAVYIAFDSEEAYRQCISRFRSGLKKASWFRPR